MNPNLFCIKAINASNFIPINNIKDVEPSGIRDRVEKRREVKNFILACEDGVYKIFDFNNYMQSLTQNQIPVELYKGVSQLNFDSKTNLILKIDKGKKNLQASDDGRFWSTQIENIKINLEPYEFVSPLIDCVYCYKNGVLYVSDYKNITYKTSINIPREGLIGMMATEYEQSILHRLKESPTGLSFYLPETDQNTQFIENYNYLSCVDKYEDLPTSGEVNKTVCKVKTQNSFFIFSGDGKWRKTFPAFKVPHEKKDLIIKGLEKKIVVFFYIDKTILIDLSTMSSVVFPKLLMIDYMLANREYINCEIYDLNNKSIINFIGEIELIDSFNRDIKLIGFWSHGYKSLIPLYFDSQENKIKSCISGEFKIYEYILTEKHVMTSYYSENGCSIPANSFNLTQDEYQIWNMVNKENTNLNLSEILENQIYTYPGQSKFLRYI